MDAVWIEAAAARGIALIGAAIDVAGVVVVDAAARDILGAAILGVNGDEVVQALLDTIPSGAGAATIARTMHIHPTVSEYLPTPMGDLSPLA